MHLQLLDGELRAVQRGVNDDGEWFGRVFQRHPCVTRHGLSCAQYSDGHDRGFEGLGGAEGARLETFQFSCTASSTLGEYDER